MCFVDLEPCQLWDERHRKARKPHRCSCCRREIRAGETYLIHFSVFEGMATTEKCCPECEADREIFAKAHDGTLCSPGWLVTMIGDCMSEEPESRAVWEPMLARIRARRNSAQVEG